MRNTAVLQLGQYAVGFLNWDVETLFRLPTQSVHKDLRNLSAVLPYVHDQDEQKEIEARLVELKEWAGRQERGKDTHSSCVSSKQTRRSRFISTASEEELTLPALT